MPGARVFLDANVVLYSREGRSSDKTSAAALWLRSLTDSGRGRMNLQVLNEVTNVMLRNRGDLTNAQVFANIDELRYFGASPLQETTVHFARTVRVSTRYSWWDCLLLASALELACTHFLSEDLQDGQVISVGDWALTIVNPFTHSPDQILSP